MVARLEMQKSSESSQFKWCQGQVCIQTGKKATNTTGKRFQGFIWLYDTKIKPIKQTDTISFELHDVHIPASGRPVSFRLVTCHLWWTPPDDQSRQCSSLVPDRRGSTSTASVWRSLQALSESVRGCLLLCVKDTAPLQEYKRATILLQHFLKG